MSKYLYRFLIAIMMIALGGLTYTASGQCLYDPSAPSTDAVELEQDDFNAPAGEPPQPLINAPTVLGTCLTVVGAIREGNLTDTGVPSPSPDIDIYQLAFSGPTAFTLRLEYNVGNSFQLVIADAASGRPIRNCLTALTPCAVQLDSTVNLTITGTYAGVYILSIINGS